MENTACSQGVMRIGVNTMQEKLEKDVISLIFREYPNLRDQINKARVVKRNFTGVCFFTDYHQNDIVFETEMVISDVGATLNGHMEVGFVFFLYKSGSCLECYTYGDSFPEKIESYEAFVYKKRPDGSYIK